MRLSDVGMAARTLFSRGIPFQDAFEEFEAAWIELAMEQNKKNQSLTARTMGIHRNTLARKIEDYQRKGLLKPKGGQELMWIQTATGKRFDLVNPKPGQVFAADIIAALPLIPCFTGQQQAGRHEFGYSTAQHCILVSRLVEPEFALTALLHDAWKVYIGDLTRPLNALLNDISGFKYSMVRADIQAAVARRFGMIYPLPDEVEQADLKARATELRDVMAPPPEPWKLQLPEPDKEIIVPLHPASVRKLFTEIWSSLEVDLNIP